MQLHKSGKTITRKAKKKLRKLKEIENWMKKGRKRKQKTGRKTEWQIWFGVFSAALRSTNDLPMCKNQRTFICDDCIWQIKHSIISLCSLILFTVSICVSYVLYFCKRYSNYNCQICKNRIKYNHIKFHQIKYITYRPRLHTLVLHWMKKSLAG